MPKPRRYPEKLHKEKCAAAFKVGYPTKKAVKTAINKHSRDDIYYYKCPECRQFHMTRSVQS